MDGARPPIALTVAGSDSGGGAGIQADLKTFSALGCFGASVVTAITAQNTQGVTAIHLVPEDVVTAQLDAVLGDIGADAVKTGMLASASLVRCVADGLRRHGVARLVVDPVMVAATGARLLEPDAVEAVRRHLLPLALVATPNLPEAEALVGGPVATEADRLEAGRRLRALGPRWVVVKGGHADGPPVDLLLGPDGEVHRLEAERVDTTSTHGTGCTFGSALCAGLAAGLSVPEAAAQAKRYVTDALAAAYPVGQGKGPVHHFHRWW